MEHINFFKPHLEKLEGQVSKPTLERLEKATTRFSKQFLKRRPKLDVASAQEEFNKMYSSPTVYELPNNMMMTDAETVFFNRLRSKINPVEVRRIANVGYSIHGYARKGIASASGTLRDFTLDPAAIVGLGWLHRGNDFAATNLMHSIMDRIEQGEREFNVVDIGAGTGGTTESQVHHAFELAKARGVDLSRFHITFHLIEQNESQVEAIRQKVGFLEKYRKAGLQFDIKVIQKDAIQALATLARTGKKIDGAIASYSMHHMRDEDKRKVMTNVKKMLKKGGVFAYNDCDGHSEINRKYFNWINLLHFSVFNSKSKARRMLKEAGFSARDLKHKEHAGRIEALYPGFVKKALEDEDASRGYYLLGVKK